MAKSPDASQRHALNRQQKKMNEMNALRGADPSEPTQQSHKQQLSVLASKPIDQLAESTKQKQKRCDDFIPPHHFMSHRFCYYLLLWRPGSLMLDGLARACMLTSDQGRASTFLFGSPPGGCWLANETNKDLKIFFPRFRSFILSMRQKCSTLLLSFRRSCSPHPLFCSRTCDRVARFNEAGALKRSYRDLRRCDFYIE